MFCCFVFYMFGFNVRVFEKVWMLDVDCFLLDLEDVVVFDVKGFVCQQIVDVVKVGGYGNCEVVIWINGFDIDWGEDDLKVVVEVGLNVILVFKVNSLVDFQCVVYMLLFYGVVLLIVFWVMMEMLEVMLNVGVIGVCGCDLEVCLFCFVMGINDFVKEICVYLVFGWVVMMLWLMICVVVVWVGGIDIFDGVYNVFQDVEGFVEECCQGVEMGMDGKIFIYFKQIVVCYEVFSLLVEEIDWVCKINQMFDQLENVDKGVIQVDGKMVEWLYVDMGKWVIVIVDVIVVC